MAVKNVRATLRRGCDELDRAGELADDAAADRVAGIEEQLRYVADGSTVDPEALVFPDPDALDTIQDTLADLIDEADDEAQLHLERARDELLQAISTLEDELEKQGASASEVT